MPRVYYHCYDDHRRTPPSWPRTRWPRPPSWRWTVTRTGWSPWTSSWRPASDSRSSASCSRSRQSRSSPSEQKQLTEGGSRIISVSKLSNASWNHFQHILDPFVFPCKHSSAFTRYLPFCSLFKTVLSINTSKLSTTRINVLY